MMSLAINIVVGWNGWKLVGYIYRECGRRRSNGKWMVVPYITPLFKGVASQQVRISRRSLGLLW
jgi:hypothetical protein